MPAFKERIDVFSWGALGPTHKLAPIRTPLEQAEVRAQKFIRACSLFDRAWKERGGKPFLTLAQLMETAKGIAEGAPVEMRGVKDLRRAARGVQSAYLALAGAVAKAKKS